MKVCPAHAAREDAHAHLSRAGLGEGRSTARSGWESIGPPGNSTAKAAIRRRCHAGSSLCRSGRRMAPFRLPRGSGARAGRRDRAPPGSRAPAAARPAGSEQIVRRQQPHRGARLDGGAPEMGSQHDAFVSQQAGLDGGLVLVDVQAGAKITPCPSASASATSSSTGPRAVLTSTAVGFIWRSRSAEISVAGLGRQGHVQADEVRSGQQVVERRRLCTGIDGARRHRGWWNNTCMPKPTARRATARPIRPKPTIPSVLPNTSWPSMNSGPHLQLPPARITRSPSARRRRPPSGAPRPCLPSTREDIGGVRHDDAPPRAAAHVNVVHPTA